MTKGSEFTTRDLNRWRNSGHKAKQKSFLWSLIPRFWRNKVRSKFKFQKRLKDFPK